jgi:hypothetical protein
VDSFLLLEQRFELAAIRGIGRGGFYSGNNVNTDLFLPTFHRFEIPHLGLN